MLINGNHRNAKKACHLLSLKVCSIVLGALLLSIKTTAWAQKSNTDITLFLPTKSEQYPNLVVDLQASLAASGLKQIKVKNADFWHPYQQGIRQGRAGIYFVQPHFASWLITQHKFKPIFKLHGQLKYVLAAKRSDTTIFEVRDLAGKWICREAGLNLGTVWLNQVFGEHQLTASGREVASVEQVMRNNESDHTDCSAYVLSDRAYQRINSKAIGGFIRLRQSPVYKHFAFVAHPSISDATVAKLQQVLKSKRSKALLNDYFTQLSKWQNLLPIKSNDYNDQDTELLKTYWAF